MLPRSIRVRTHVCLGGNGLQGRMQRGQQLDIMGAWIDQGRLMLRLAMIHLCQEREQRLKEWKGCPCWMPRRGMSLIMGMVGMMARRDRMRNRVKAKGADGDWR